MTVRYRSLTFRVFARAGNTVHALLQVPHEEFPFGLSQCSPILPPRQTEPLDDWSKGFLNLFNAGWETLNPWRRCG